MTDQKFENLKPINAGTVATLAGKAAFHRGEVYYRDGRVGELQWRGIHITAIVEGNEEYQVRLTHTAKIFEGICDCPASEGFDFCKHCAATALKYLEQASQQEKLLASSAGNLLENYLHSMDKAALAAELLTLIEFDSELTQKWVLRAELAAGKMNARSFKKHITKAIPYNRNLYRYAQVRNYFSRVEALVDTSRQVLTALDTEQSLELINYALLRINRALETIDDSGGFRFDSVTELGELHIQILADSGWSLKKMTAYLHELYSSGEVELYPTIPGEYMELLGSEGLALFNAPLQAEWDDMPDLESGGHEDWNTTYRYQRVQAPLLLAATLDNNFDRKLELLAKTANKIHHMTSLSRHCLEQDRIEQAIEWWKKAHAAARNDHRHRNTFDLDELEIEILCFQKKFAQALKLRWSGFKDSPSINSYRILLAMALSAGDETDFYQQTLDFLTPKIREAGQFGRVTYDLVCEIHLEEHNPQLALEIASKHELNPDTLLRVIRANPRRQAEILPLYVELAELHIQRTNNNAYRDAIKLLKEANTLAKDALEKPLKADFLRLRTQYKAKRNFVKLFDQAFPQIERSGYSIPI
jgi:uncharacterized Zn finger protein